MPGRDQFVEPGAAPNLQQDLATPVASRHMIEQARIPAGSFTMGDSSGDRHRADGETPRHRVALSAFDIDVTTVRNADFARFVEDTGYRTEAELFGFSAVFHLAVTAEACEIMGPAAGAPWWRGVQGASWRRPGGSCSDLEGRESHPVVHVSWNDAIAYCDWAGRLRSRQQVGIATRADEVFVFPTSRRHGMPDQDAMKNSLRRSFDAAGHPEMTLHSIRRMVERRLEEAGLSRMDRESIMGHTVQVAERHYSTHGVPERGLEALGRPEERSRGESKV
ncbi:SUMF1/EgtB/PvdO family nonheme iron enzyme [Brachybacterium fresconis]|uniref:Sulfatase-modifying factor enzyme-like domain-containing protein n=1 Tax=Brachybacterium fresconis TaxID=173363 RepID=A0ABS4YI27_9MICO|nr:SUMF1/EgtB/PvdO family nonheme iron enzyme [Brachybacterium fresconis]MBP2407548.1 hypothetical protein [Brachybacterium fresconis]